MRESVVSNARYTRGDGDESEAATTPESIFPNARHTVHFAVISDGGGNGDTSAVQII